MNHSQRGSTMIEILVSIVIIAIGLLGYAGLLTQSIKHSQSAYYRSLATMQTYDIVDRMRVNRPMAIAGNYSINLGSAPSAGSVAGDDLVGWKTSLARDMPVGDGSVLVDISGNVTITIQWDDPSNGTTTFTTQTSL